MKNCIDDIFKVTSKTKEDYLTKINLFINSKPNYKPVMKYYKYRISHTSAMNDYIHKNDLIELNMNYFILERLPSNIYNISESKDIAIVFDAKSNQNKIIVQRTWYGFPSELSSKLGVSTLAEIYNRFVDNIIDYSNITRIIKEMNSINNNKFFIFEKKTNVIYLVNKLEYNDLKNQFTLDTKVCDLSKIFDLTKQTIRPLILSLNLKQALNMLDNIYSLDNLDYFLNNFKENAINYLHEHFINDVKLAFFN